MATPEGRTLREWQSDFNDGRLGDGADAGWVAWHCKDDELAAKTKALGAAVARIADGGKVDLDSQYVFFTENATEQGTFADFRIADIVGGNVWFKVTMGEPDERFDKSDMKGRKWHVYGGPSRMFRKPIKAFKTDATLAKWMNTPYSG